MSKVEYNVLLYENVQVEYGVFLKKIKAKTARLHELNMDKSENEIVGGEPDEGEELPVRKKSDKER